MAIYADNSNGQEISWVGTTYEYRYKNGIMHIDLWDPDGTLLFGHAALRKSGDKLAGTLEFGRTTYQVTFSPAKNGQSIYNTAPGTVNVGSSSEAGGEQAMTSVGIFSVVLEGAQVLAKSKG